MEKSVKKEGVKSPRGNRKPGGKTEAKPREKSANAKQEAPHGNKSDHEAARARKERTGKGHEPWTRKSLEGWLKNHVGSTVMIRREHSTFRVAGVNLGVEKLDACSTEVWEADLDVGMEGVQVGMSLMEDSLAIQVLIPGHKAGEALLSVPMTIPYAELQLTRMEQSGEDGRLNVKRTGRGAQHETIETEEEYSPYELLFSGSE